MSKKALIGIILIVFLLLTIPLVAKSAICEVTARQTIIIQSDGSIYPADAPIQQNGNTYTLTRDIFDPILIEKSNITFEGNGCSLVGPLNETERKAEQIIGIGPNNETQVPYIIGIDVDDTVSGVTIRNLNVHNFSIGAYIRSTNNTFTCNGVTDNIVGVLLSGSTNTITYNYISGNEQGLFFGFETVNGVGNIPSNIQISHNSFIENARQLSGCVCKEYNLSETRHSWDDGKEGNYWSDYNGTDANNDGIGDTAYIVDILNQDSFPLMQSPASVPTTIPSTPQFPIQAVVFIIILVIIVLFVILIFRRNRKSV
jgi:hypothetical protein